MFDGARSFEGVTSDLALHCERVVNSWRAFTMNLTVSVHEMVEIALDGVAKFPNGAEPYMRPMFWAQEGWIAPDLASTQFAMLVDKPPLPPVTGFGICLSTCR